MFENRLIKRTVPLLNAERAVAQMHDNKSGYRFYSKIITAVIS